jgi:antitoxin component of RelBE/YafQ-DinJ toxin-antitoxin module
MSMSRLNETITVKLPQDVRNELAEVARDNGMSMSHVVREYIIEGLKRDN